jgi:hypothetical protein
MADYVVSYQSGSTDVSYQDGNINTYSVTAERAIVADRLSDLSDVTVADLPNKDQYVLVYDATLQKYKLVNPDAVLSSAAASELNQPGLPADFEDILDIDLDNRIDVDAGTF